MTGQSNWCLKAALTRAETEKAVGSMTIGTTFTMKKFTMATQQKLAKWLRVLRRSLSLVTD